VLAVVFSETALGRFLDAYLSPTDAAVFAAYWGLLNGQVDGTVRIVTDSHAFTQYYWHFCREYSGLSNNTDESKQGHAGSSVFMHGAERHDPVKESDCEHD
jgi:hypothetical protein